VSIGAEFLEHAKDLFAPFTAVQIKRMFGGAGIFRDGLMFALATGDLIYLKVDADTEATFREAGCEPFSYGTRNGTRTTLGYWTLPDEAQDDPDALRRWAGLAWDAALRAAKKTPAKRRKA
jgi:DNA transformation protein